MALAKEPAKITMTLMPEPQNSRIKNGSNSTSVVPV